MTAKTYIYFFKPVGRKGPIKVGCSEAPKLRLETFAAWSPVPLVFIGMVPGTLKDEQFLHRCFADSHSHGEWFQATSEVVDAIERILAAGDFEKVRPTLVEKGSIRRKRKPATPEWRLCRSYQCKIDWATRKLRKLDENGAWHAPEDVEGILTRWRRHIRIEMREGGRAPTKEELARLDEYLASPAAHSIIPLWRRQRAA